MAQISTNIGEEWYTDTAMGGVTSVRLGLYLDASAQSGDQVSVGDDLAAITTEPSGAAYARQDAAISTGVVLGSQFGFLNQVQESFDVSDSKRDVDSWFAVADFQSDKVAGDPSAGAHLMGTGSLSQLRNTSQIDTLNVNANGAGIYMQEPGG